MNKTEAFLAGMKSHGQKWGSSLGPVMSGGEEKKIVTIVGRSLHPVYVEWVGTWVIHDFATMRKKAVTPICWNHGEVIGKQVGEHRITENGLEMDAELPPRSDEPADVVNRVIWMLENKIPLESSIQFSGDCEVKFYDSGTLELNGSKIEVPVEGLLVVSNWTLRELSICDLGQDPHTVSAASNFRAASCGQTHKTQPEGGVPMPVPKKMTEEAGKNPEENEIPAVPPKTESETPDTESRLKTLEEGLAALQSALAEMNETLTPSAEKREVPSACPPKKPEAQMRQKTMPSVSFGLQNEGASKLNRLTTWRSFVANYQKENGISSYAAAFTACKEEYPEIYSKFIQK